MKLLSYMLYQVALLLLTPLGLLLTLRDAKRRNGGTRFVQQRLGFGYTHCEQAPIWFHAASLGEVNAIAPLLKRLKQDQPNTAILVTTTTPSGAAAAANIDGIIQAYLPIDLPWGVYNFLKQYKPQHGVIAETELWPNLLVMAKRAGCPPTIINGRLSDKTLNKQWLYPLFKLCLQQCGMIFTRSHKDNNHFQQLGADKSQLLTVGNIKFAGQLHQADDYERLIDQPYILAASTHEDEEWQFCHSLAASGKLIVIIPRHPERRDDILRSLNRLPLKIAVRSTDDAVDAQTQVYIADTIGEMMSFMAHAELVFMGGSLIPHGGQNMLEAARLGKAVICGPHTHNFIDEVAALKDIEALLEVQNTDELRNTVNELLGQSDRLQDMGNKASELMKNNGGIAKQYFKLLLEQWK